MRRRIRNRSFISPRGAVRQPTGSGRRRMGRGPVRSRPAPAPQGRPARTPVFAGRRRPTQRLTAQQRARLAAQRRATGSSKRKPTQKMMAQQLAVMKADKQKRKQTPVRTRSGLTASAKYAPRPSVNLRRGVSRITTRRA